MPEGSENGRMHGAVFLGLTKDKREDIIEYLKTVYDPEIPVDIYQLGLIYGGFPGDIVNPRIEDSLDIGLWHGDGVSGVAGDPSS